MIKSDLKTLPEKTSKGRFEAIVIGGSAGSYTPFKEIISSLHPNFSCPIMIVMHLNRNQDGAIANDLNKLSKVEVKENIEREYPEPGVVYFAPANYHLLIAKDKTLALSTAPPVNFSRPSIDELFETAAEAYGCNLIGILLSGANSDGCSGLKRIKEKGGFSIVQDPADAEIQYMPKRSIELSQVDLVLSPEQIGNFLNKIIGT
jgi:two-component system, chemotaxis family, protein-glutamate methylesterase/glutaminase